MGPFVVDGVGGRLAGEGDVCRGEGVVEDVGLVCVWVLVRFFV